MAGAVDEGWAPDAAMRLEARVARVATAERLFGAATDAPVRLGPYELVRQIGAGGTGLVFEGRDARTGQRVAVKVLRRPGTQASQGLRREFRTVAELDHPNLVPLYEIAEEGELAFIAMELVEGCSLKRYVHHTDALDLTRLERAMAQLVDAVSTLHAAGVLHCDLKPENVIVRADGRVIVLDFDLARPLTETRASTGSGTPRYLAPERLRGQPASEASDWFSVGVMLHDVLTRDVPDVSGMHAQPVQPAPPASHEVRALLELCRRLLADQPNTRPSSSELRARFGLVEVARPHGPMRAVGSGHELFGREVELDALHAAFARARSGRSVLVQIHGEPGIGKTALARQFIAEATRDIDACVLASRCYEGDLIAFNAVDGVIDALRLELQKVPHAIPAARDAEALARVFPALRELLVPGGPAPAEGDAHAIRQRAFSTLASILRSLAQTRPLLVHLDDLQWGDPDSAQLLRELLREPAGTPLLLLAGYRSEHSAAAPCVRALADAAHDALEKIELRLARLPDAVALELARSLHAGDTDEETLATISREAEGNPLFVRALVEHAKHGATPAQAPGSQSSFSRTLEAALARLPASCRPLLELTVLATRPLERELLLRAAAAIAEHEPWPSYLNQLKRAGLLRAASGDPNAVESYHDRVRETLASAIEYDRRRSYHKELADAAANTADPDFEFLAYHYAGADRHEEAARFAELCGDRAFAAIALERAAEFYRLALDNLGGSRPASLVEKLANAVAFTGRCEPAAPLYLEAAKRVNADQRSRLQLRGAEMFLRAGRFEEAAALFNPILGAVGVRYPSSSSLAIIETAVTIARTELKLWLGPKRNSTRGANVADHLRNEVCFALGYRLSSAEPARACAVLARSLFWALDSGSDAQLARGLACHALVLAMLGRSSSARQDALLARARELADVTGDPEVIGWILYFYARVCCSRGDFSESLVWIDKARTWISERCTDTGWILQDLDSGATSMCAITGRFVELNRISKALSIRNQITGDQLPNDNILYASMGSIACDDASTALVRADEVLKREFNYHDSHLRVVAVWVKTNALLYVGDYEAAWLLLQGERAPLNRGAVKRLCPWNQALPWLTATVALACVGSGLRGPYRRNVVKCIARLRRFPGRLAAGFRELLEAGLAHLEGRNDEACSHYARASAAFDSLSILGHASASRIREAELLGAAGESQRRQAEAWFASEQVANPQRWVKMCAPID